MKDGGVYHDLFTTQAERYIASVDEENPEGFTPNGAPPFGGRPPFGGKPPFDGKPPFGGKPPFDGKPPFGGKPPFDAKPGEKPQAEKKD